MTTLVLPRRRASIRGIVVVAAAVATGFAVYSYLSWLRAQVPVAGHLVSVVVAARDVEAGVSITPEMLRIARMPDRYLPAAVLRDPARAIGRTTSSPLFEGETVTIRRLSADGGLSASVPKGMRAYSLSISSGSSLGFSPKPGDRVDVIVTYLREVLGEAQAITVLRNAQVLASGGKVRSSFASGKVTDRLGLDGSSGPGSAITLLVSPQDSERLAMAEALGRITVVLAPSKPDGQSPPAPISPKDVRAQ
ncbi:MAG: Flp pilus assembly protein CpaB [Actinomycetota bacterium]|nr:Flp pilus assembly protein CpaB [Actinomycetota bacterium]